MVTKEEQQQLIILEEFRNCVPEVVATYQSKQRVTKVEEADVLADEYFVAKQVRIRA